MNSTDGHLPVPSGSPKLWARATAEEAILFADEGMQVLGFLLFLFLLLIATVTVGVAAGRRR
ncbi:hypothetical protein GCM10009761_27900 [Agromyces terreus]